MPPKNLKRGGQSKGTMVPKRSKRRWTTNPRYATHDRTDGDMMGATRYRDKRRTRQSPNLQNNTAPRVSKMEWRTWLFSPPSSSAPSRVQNLDRENLTHQSDTAVLNVESQPPGMNPTRIDFCGPWQPINDTTISQAGFDFDTVNKAPGGLDVSGLGHPRPLQHLGISDLPIGGLQRGEGFRQAVH